MALLQALLSDAMKPCGPEPITPAVGPTKVVLLTKAVRFSPPPHQTLAGSLTQNNMRQAFQVCLGREGCTLPCPAAHKLTSRR